MWNNGMVTSTTDVGSRSHLGDTGGIRAPRLALVSMTPLGRPVVPEVYSWRITSSASETASVSVALWRPTQFS
jgi:hypothetical protein